MEIEFPLEFLVFGTPASLQGSRRSKSAWKKAVKDASYAALPEQHWWSEDEVSVTIYYFPSEDMEGDIDNIIKMILDAISGHIIKDDKQVARVVIQRFNPDSAFEFADPSEVIVRALLSNDPCVYIKISNNVTEELR